LGKCDNLHFKEKSPIQAIIEKRHPKLDQSELGTIKILPCQDFEFRILLVSGNLADFLVTTEDELLGLVKLKTL
jgi:hypothetical protein